MPWAGAAPGLLCSLVKVVGGVQALSKGTSVTAARQRLLLSCVCVCNWNSE